MSQKQLQRIVVIENAVAGRVSVAEAAEALTARILPKGTSPSTERRRYDRQLAAVRHGRQPLIHQAGLLESLECADCEDMLSNTPGSAISALPKPVLDRIHRYAAEGRVLQVSYEDDCCRLLAVANWQLPAVILRSSRDKFADLRSAAQIEWTRAARRQCRSKNLGLIPSK